MSIQQNYGNIKPSLNLDFANTKQLDPRITYSRASTGTYYDGKTVAKAEENLLTYSQEFDTAVWIKLNTTVTANAGIAPDGTSTADKIIASATTGLQALYRESGVALSSQTVSIFVKAAEYGFATVSYFPSSIAINRYAVTVNLSTGVVTQENGLISGYSNSITSVGNGWYRVTITSNITSVTASIAVSGCPTGTPTISAGVTSFTGDGTSGIFIWGAQLEQRSFATAYTPTTTAPITNYIPVLQTASAGTPRFDHNPITGESLGLLIEEQRTNLLTFSEQFDNAAWTKSGSTITANAVAAPDGTLTADAVFETATTAQHSILRLPGVGVATYNYSFFAKANGRTQVQIEQESGGTSRFTLTGDGTAVALGSNTVSITAVGNGWYRCTTTFTATGPFGIYTHLYNGTSTSYSGDGFSGIYIWGAQLEAGAFATSYIPTVASQVTRAADSASMTGTNFSSWYNQGEGTLYADFVGANPSSAIVGIASIGSGSTNYVDIRTGSTLQSVTVVSGTQQTGIPMATYSANTSFRGATGYKFNDSAAAANGGVVSVDSSASVPPATTLYLASTGGVIPSSCTIKKLAYYPRRITNTQLQALTT